MDDPSPAGSAKPLPLILARELASNLATPMFLLDANGMLVFYNDAAELDHRQGVRGARRDPAERVRRGAAAVETATARPCGAATRPRASRSSSAAPRTKTLAVDRLRRRPPAGRGDRVPVVRHRGGDARRRVACSGQLPDAAGDDLMQARVWGCRGSVAAPGPTPSSTAATRRASRCARRAATLLVLDAGTGMRPLGRRDGRRRLADELHILLTHLHLDHLQGLGFFRPLFGPGVDIHIWGPASPVQSLAERIAMYLSPPLFPVRLADIPSNLTFHDAPEEAVTIGSATVRAGEGRAPGSDRRLPDRGGRPLARLPPRPRAFARCRARGPAAEWISGHDIARDADVLLHDAQYGDDEYPNHVGWGHSRHRARDGVRRQGRASASSCCSTTIRTTPTTSSRRCSSRRDAQCEADGDDVCLAYEGMTIALDRDGVQLAS